MLVGDVLGRRFGSRDAGVADQDVDAALFSHHPRRRGVDLLRVGDLHLDRVGRVALGFHRRLGFARRLEIAVGDIDMGAGFGQRLDAGEANPLRGAGDDRDATLEIEAIEIHGSEASAALSSVRPLAAIDAACPRGRQAREIVVGRARLLPRAQALPDRYPASVDRTPCAHRLESASENAPT